MFLSTRISSAARLVGATALLMLIGAHAGDGQPRAQHALPPGLTVTPVRITMPSGQMTTTLTIDNNTGREIGFQVRPFTWSEPGGATEQLTRTDNLAVSPPIGTIPNGGRQVVRLVLRQAAKGGQESDYRILFDQVPPPPQPGVVNFAYRFSIPVFVQSAATTRAAPRVRWSLQNDRGAYYLVATNSGGAHDAFHNIALVSPRGPITVQQDSSPYVLPGATRRWRITSNGFSPSGQALRVTAQADSGPVDQPVAGP